MRHPSRLHSGDTDWPKVRLLVYSRDDGFRFLARSTFRKLNLREVLSTSEPADATPLLRQAPHIALVDLGGEPDKALLFLERLRLADGALPVLVVGGEDREAVAEAALLGIEGIVPRPVSGHELAHRAALTLAAPQRLPVPAGARRRFTTAPPEPVPPSAPSARPKPVTAAPSRPVTVAVADAAPPPPKPAPARLAEEDIVQAPRRASGRLTDDDLAPPPSVAPPRRAPGLAEADPPEVAKARSRAAWDEALAEAKHKPRKGRDTPKLDLAAVVGEHVKWLQSKGAEGKRANFEGMDLAGADLAGSVLANASFKGADLSDARLTDCRLDGADFRRATLSAADLAGANLGVAHLRHANLRLANLEGAVLRGADLSGADLAGARLAGADLKGATMVSTDLRAADLSRAENLGQGQVNKTLCGMETKLPPGLWRPAREEEE